MQTSLPVNSRGRAIWTPFEPKARRNRIPRRTGWQLLAYIGQGVVDIKQITHMMHSALQQHTDRLKAKLLVTADRLLTG